MVSVLKILNVAKNFKTIINSAASTSISNVLLTRILYKQQNVKSAVLGAVTARSFHSTSQCRGLMEFFDDPKNWPENEVKVGRAWKLEELRIKSNKELHQLWYILLKERNMLLTMEHECNDKMELFPSPERLDKVKISMENLESVVRERNKAYHLLETGETGERPSRVVSNQLGIRYLYRSCEHVLPPYMNVKWIKSRNIGFGGRAVRKFLLLYREKLYNIKRKAKNRSRNEVMMMLRRNPNIDVHMLRRKYPDVDIDKLLRDDKTRGHCVPKVDV
ncbi:LOW QUALITY PROTEIN: 39S ribosomal protein L47, mitochondrial [Rhagoletis pomonella]|uniref:LOW QUALITY PROTEIN: 39S ribosomal protein L47, mitochondrial n=1 Tax=Rhagoletis pomonella TaxID=28610 RepID=UPI0017868E23|nr:LOW QUALITY PROTEIN: 39S ribosomal protein L47, mitochondrial [Rhagoletis pomonella]